MDEPNMITAILCPDCGSPPQIIMQSDGTADCLCANVDCMSHDMENANSWRYALQQWNENVFKAYAERSESPISTPSDSEPAPVENRPQDGSETLIPVDEPDAGYHLKTDCTHSKDARLFSDGLSDTREQLEADIYVKLNDMRTYSWRTDGIMRQAKQWLDRLMRNHWRFRQYMEAATGRHWWPR